VWVAHGRGCLRALAEQNRSHTGGAGGATANAVHENDEPSKSRGIISLVYDISIKTAKSSSSKQFLNFVFHFVYRIFQQLFCAIFCDP